SWIYPNQQLPSGITLNHKPQPAGQITLGELGKVRDGLSQLWCFIQIEYLDSLEEPMHLRSTAGCRALKVIEAGALSQLQGAWVQTDDTRESEYNYAD